MPALGSTGLAPLAAGEADQLDWTGGLPAGTLGPPGTVVGRGGGINLGLFLETLSRISANHNEDENSDSGLGEGIGERPWADWKDIAEFNIVLGICSGGRGGEGYCKLGWMKELGISPCGCAEAHRESATSDMPEGLFPPPRSSWCW